MRQIDARAVSLGLLVYLMMENAGNALTRHMIKGLGSHSKKKTVTIMCGLSNNSGGGFASARHMRYYGANVNVILLGRPKDIRTKDAKLQWKTLEKFESILLNSNQIVLVSELFAWWNIAQVRTNCRNC